MSGNTTVPPSSPLSLQSSLQPDGAVIIKCSGRLISGVTDELHVEVKSWFPRTKRIILDLTDLAQMDSSGLGAIAALFISAKTAGVRLEMINLNKRVRELFSITNLITLFEPYGEHNIRM
jgi:anti-sigma B factor antagonist